MAQIKKLILNGKTIYPVTHPKAVIDPSSGRNITAAATQSANGLMSAADKKKLDAFGAASNYVTTDTTQHITGGKYFDSLSMLGAIVFTPNYRNSTANCYLQATTDPLVDADYRFQLSAGYNSQSVNKSGEFQFITHNGSYAYSMYLTKEGNLHVQGTVTQSSDVNIKDNIQIIDDISNVNKIFAKSYTLKSDSDKKIHYGFIAQDVEQYFPELVSEMQDPNNESKAIKSLNYNELLVLKTAYLEKKNADLEARIQNLESLVAKLPQSETEV